MEIGPGFWCGEGSNFGHFHWLASSPLQHSRTKRQRKFFFRGGGEGESGLFSNRPWQHWSIESTVIIHSVQCQFVYIVVTWLIGHARLVLHEAAAAGSLAVTMATGNAPLHAQTCRKCLWVESCLIECKHQHTPGQSTVELPLNKYTDEEYLEMWIVIAEESHGATRYCIVDRKMCVTWDASALRL